jgi:hypothetical protein
MTRLIDDWCVPDLKDEPNIAAQWQVGLNSTHFRHLPRGRSPVSKLPATLGGFFAAGRARRAAFVDTRMTPPCAQLLLADAATRPAV